MSFNGSYLKFLYLSPRGRITRREYAYYYFWPVAVLPLVMGLLDILLGNAGKEPSLVVPAILVLVFFWPTVCMHAKRLHDIGKSGWMQLLPLLPLTAGVAIMVTGLSTMGGIIISGGGYLICAILLLTWLTRKGEEGENRFGPAPVARDFKGHVFRYSILGVVFGLPALAVVLGFVAGFFMSTASHLSPPPPAQTLTAPAPAPSAP